MRGHTGQYGRARAQRVRCAGPGPCGESRPRHAACPECHVTVRSEKRNFNYPERAVVLRSDPRMGSGADMTPGDHGRPGLGALSPAIRPAAHIAALSGPSGVRPSGVGAGAGYGMDSGGYTPHGATPSATATSGIPAPVRAGSSWGSGRHEPVITSSSLAGRSESLVTWGLPGSRRNSGWWARISAASAVTWAAAVPVPLSGP